MHVTFVAPSLAGGGAERGMCLLANALAERDYSVSVVTYTEEPDRYALSPAVHRTHVPLPRRPMRSWRALRALRSALTGDVVVSFVEGTNELVLLSTLGSRVPRVGCYQNEIRHHPAPRRIRLLRRLLYPLAERVVFLDPDIPAPRAWRSTAIPNLLASVGTERRKPPGNFARTLVAMGRLVPQKGFDLLIRAWETIAPRHPDWGLVIFGEGPQRFAPAERVIFAGATSDPFPYLRGADLFALSSRYEGQGLALLEAMACGLPAVSFACPTGPEKIVRHEIDGLIVPPGDTDAFARALSRLMGDDALRARYAARASDVTARFPAEPIIAAWERLFAEV